MTVKVRFAPSPTGYLHVGNVRTALINYLLARKQDGEFFLRMDDTDTQRSKDEYERGIMEDMRWLGLEWDSEIIRQRDRFALYEAAKDKLVAAGRLYPCYETPEELEIKRKMLAGRGLPPVYDRAALKLTDEQRMQYEQEGRKPHWRFLLGGEDIIFNDLIRGEVRFTPGHISDPVLIRADGVPLYTLSSVVDDGEMGITHIMRGEDHVTNTAVQLQIFTALGYEIPQFGHNALLKMKEGKLSKRSGDGGDIRSLREAGLEAMTINSYLAKIGTSDAIEAFSHMEELIESFDLSKFGRAMATYDEQELERLNEKLLHLLPYRDVKPRLEEYGLGQIDEKFWESVKNNLHTLTEIGHWWEIVNGDISPPISEEDREFLRKAGELLPASPWSEQSWSEWISSVKKQTGRSGKGLFMPIRLTITGREDGPELKKVFLLLGEDRVKARLLGVTV